MTISVSTVISAFNSLTLSPALAAILLKPANAKPDIVARVLDFTLGLVLPILQLEFPPRDQRVSARGRDRAARRGDRARLVRRAARV